jgi:hypothetical protein
MKIKIKYTVTFLFFSGTYGIIFSKNFWCDATPADTVPYLPVPLSTTDMKISENLDVSILYQFFSFPVPAVFRILLLEQKCRIFFCVSRLDGIGQCLVSDPFLCYVMLSEKSCLHFLLLEFLLSLYL